MESLMPEKDKTDYRWCEKREQMVALTVCERLAEKKRFCRLCIARHEQLPLPFDFSRPRKTRS